MGNSWDIGYSSEKKVEKRETTNQLLGNQSWLAGKPISFGDFPELRLTKRKGIIQNQLALPPVILAS
jgi:hypothetical protein